MKKLSICIPTYNRNTELVALVENFLIRALDGYEDIIEVIVSDNSDDPIATLNRASLDSRIKYSKNITNMGFSGNIRRCISLAEGQYLWIISDDDMIIWDGFVELMLQLDSCNGEGVDVIFAPVIASTLHGEKLTINGLDDWRCHSECRFGDILAKGRIPFLFIASGIIRNEFDCEIIDSLSKTDNDYYQVLIYCSRLTNMSVVRFLEKGLVEYKSGGKVRFSIYSISRSMQFLIEYFQANFHVSIRYSPIYSEHLKWLLHHRAGISNVYNGTCDRMKIIKYLPKYFSIKNTLFCIALMFPKIMIKAVFVSYYALKATHKGKKLTFFNFFHSVSSYWQLLSFDGSEPE